MDYNIMAKAILKAVGGENNIIDLAHCLTRLRLSLNNKSDIDYISIEKIPGVIGAIDKSDQLHIIIGINVVKCYAEMQKLLKLNSLRELT